MPKFGVFILLLLGFCMMVNLKFLYRRDESTPLVDPPPQHFAVNNDPASSSEDSFVSEFRERPDVRKHDLKFNTIALNRNEPETERADDNLKLPDDQIDQSLKGIDAPPPPLPVTASSSSPDGAAEDKVVRAKIESCSG